ncbi:hypothetical protein F5887DRAFT_943148 [Amanita rubescens]|nr:hypothetical protein F5887DRAFT_943148 [Amanita rubescens]
MLRTFLCSTTCHQRCIMNIAITLHRVQTRGRPAMQNTDLLGPDHIPPISRLYSDHANLQIPSLVHSIITTKHDEPQKLRKIRASPDKLEYFVNVDNVRHVAEAIACKDPRHVAQFIALSHKLGCHHTQNVYECVCFRLANGNYWLHILSVVSLGMENTARTTSRLLNWKARSLLELKRYGQLNGILEEFKLHNLKPSRRTYHFVLSGHLRNRDILQARDCLQLMEEAGFPPDPSTHALLATNYRLLGFDANVESRTLRALEGLDSAKSVATLNSLIQLRLSRHDIPGVFFLFAHFDPPSVQALVLALRSTSKPAGIFDFSHKPHSSLTNPLIPNASTYAIVIHYLSGRVDIGGILDVLRAMDMNNIKVTSAVIVSLIHALASAGYIDIAVKLVTGTCDKQKISMEIFSSLVPNTNILHLPIDCTGVQPSAALFNALLEHTLKLHGFKAMFNVLQVMRINRIIPDSATLEAFISYLQKNENVRPSIIFRLLRHLYSDDVSPTSHHLHIVLSCILRRENLQSMPRLPYPESRITNTSDSLGSTAGLQIPRYKRYKTLARHLTELLSVQEVNSDAAAFALRIRHDAIIRSDIDTAKDVFRTLLSRGMHATEYHYAALMEGYAISGEMDRAEELLGSMRNVGIKPNVVIYTILIHGHGRDRNPRKALGIFQQMINAGCQPDVPAIDALCCAFFAFGARNTAKKLLISCWAYIQPFPDEFQSLPLQELAIRFRALHKSGDSVPQKASKQERLLLHYKITRILKRWKSMDYQVSVVKVWRERRKMRRVEGWLTKSRHQRRSKGQGWKRQGRSEENG